VSLGFGGRNRGREFEFLASLGRFHLALLIGTFLLAVEDQMLTRCRDFCLASLVTGFYWAFSRLWFFRHVNHPQALGDGPVLYAHWHGDELLLIGAYTHRRMAIMASRSRDGEWLKRILEWLGFYVVRGSSSRGGAAGLKGLIDAVNKEGYNASLAVDGPRGPIYQVKPGILKLAQETQRPIIPGGAASSRRIVFKKAWNRCYLPLPLSRCVIVYGEPLRVPPTTTEEEFESLRAELERRLLALKVEAENRFRPGFQTALRPLTDSAGV
jgi:lysophospholipid acyltransferase (LPLAT)-like uncharacterized protein